ncbi:Trans-L-3-hydroxyproline dehydratase [Fonsecaea pedrosoi]|nr:Trans-L-3-hydroxyproline dehydratase [Fonsecaea pedrosoi]
MDIKQLLLQPVNRPISCIEMHTCGEPTRIVIDGYPDLHGTLLEQRAEAKTKYDSLRQRVLLEPRGHYDMYGAILRPQTELTTSGKADMGVLFMTNDGYSTMCGHATIALGRFLVDTHDLAIFPRRNEIKYDPHTRYAVINLHAPCGLVEVTVPTNEDGSASDPQRPVSFVSVPSFAKGINITIPVPAHLRWSELQEDRTEVRASFAYGGAFYCIVAAVELGFANGLRAVDLEALNRASRGLKSAILDNASLSRYYEHRAEPEMSFLYGVIVTDHMEAQNESVSGSELGVCYFAAEEIDRSPTGSGVAARAALAYRDGTRKANESWAYHSLVSKLGIGPPFIGTVLERNMVGQPDEPSATSEDMEVRVKVEGQAYYTGFSTFSVEKDDPLGDSGFAFRNLSVP